MCSARDRLLALGLFLIFRTGAAFAGDTPFIVYDCIYGKPAQKDSFVLEFKNDDSEEVATWATGFKRTRMEFTKKDRKSLGVRIVTGLPLVAYAAPEEYRFSAPMTTDRFDFSIVLKDATQVHATVLGLVCQRRPSLD